MNEYSNKFDEKNFLKIRKRFRSAIIPVVLSTLLAFSVISYFLINIFTKSLFSDIDLNRITILISILLSVFIITMIMSYIFSNAVLMSLFNKTKWTHKKLIAEQKKIAKTSNIPIISTWKIHKFLKLKDLIYDEANIDNKNWDYHENFIKFCLSKNEEIQKLKEVKISRRKMDLSFLLCLILAIPSIVLTILYGVNVEIGFDSLYLIIGLFSGLLIVATLASVFSFKQNDLIYRTNWYTQERNAYTEQFETSQDFRSSGGYYFYRQFMDIKEPEIKKPSN